MVNVKEIIEKMSLIQKASLMSGKDHWQTRDIKEFSIPSLFLSDGPHGLRKQAGESDHLGQNPSLKSTCYPTAATIANSWNDELIEKMGQHLGIEANSQNVNMILGPGLNIKRNPLCGRNFEYFSEDPLLSGKLAASLIRGIQSEGVIACPKHFAVNNQEFKRMVSDSVVDERTLRELYLTGFEIAVKEGQSKAIMSSYNRINGIYANENSHLLQKILKDEWNFNGLVVTDWGGSNDHILGVKNGSHLEMPSTGKVGIKEIVQAVENGSLDERILDQRVEEYLNVVLDEKFQDHAKNSELFNFDQHHEFARQIARDSFVLLKNEQHILPLSKHLKLAVIGHFAELPRYQGAGSSLVNPTKLESFLDVLKGQSTYQYTFSKGYERNKETQEALIKEAVQSAEANDAILLFVGLDELAEVEGKDRSDLKIPQNQLDLINVLTEVKKPLIIVLSAGSVIEMPWLEKVDAVLHTYLSGQAGAKATLDILSGDYCPSGKLAETYPLVYEDVSNKNYYPALKDVALYKESLYVGYRYFETVNKSVRFPFGFGLSYTEFKLSNFKFNKKDLTINCSIENSGDFDGSEIIQVYISRKDESNIFRAEKSLVAYKKIYLKSRESKDIEIVLSEDAFRYFDVHYDEYCIEKGKYTINVGNSIKNIIFATDITVSKSSIYPIVETNLGSIDEKLIPYQNGHIETISDEAFDMLMENSVRKVNLESNELQRTNTLADLKNSKNIIGRFVFKQLEKQRIKSEKNGKPDLNLLFLYNMPFRNISKMTGGSVNMKMVDSILKIFNGHGFIGFFSLINASICHTFEKKYISKG